MIVEREGEVVGYGDLTIRGDQVRLDLGGVEQEAVLGGARAPRGRARLGRPPRRARAGPDARRARAERLRRDPRRRTTWRSRSRPLTPSRAGRPGSRRAARGRRPADVPPRPGGGVRRPLGLRAARLRGVLAPLRDDAAVRPRTSGCSPRPRGDAAGIAICEGGTRGRRGDRLGARARRPSAVARPRARLRAAALVVRGAARAWARAGRARRRRREHRPARSRLYERAGMRVTGAYEHLGQAAVSRLRARCPDCRTLTAVALGPEYECHSCGREFAAGLVRVPRAWGTDGEAMAEAALPAAAVPGDGGRRGGDARGADARRSRPTCPTRPLVLGGCCCSHVGAVEGLAARPGGRLAVVWLDAHGDLNTPETLAVRQRVGDAAADADRRGRGATPSDVALVGARNLDPPEASSSPRAGIDDDVGARARRRRARLRRARPRRAAARRGGRVHARAGRADARGGRGAAARDRRRRCRSPASASAAAARPRATRPSSPGWRAALGL